MVVTLGCAAGANDAPPADGVHLFTGTYRWLRGGSDELVAEFKPTGEDAWAVRVRFTFQGRNNIWKGTATGSLYDGTDVIGMVRGGGGREWGFEGAIEDGVLTAQHYELIDGERADTGSFSIAR